MDNKVRALSELGGVTPEGNSRITEANIREDINTMHNMSHVPLTDRQAIDIIRG